MGQLPFVQGAEEARRSEAEPPSSAQKLPLPEDVPSTPGTETIPVLLIRDTIDVDVMQDRSVYQLKFPSEHLIQ